MMNNTSSTPEDLANELQAVLANLCTRIGGICADCVSKNLLKRLLKTQDRVYWKRHGVVVSNRSLKDYRGASVTVETKHAAAVVHLLEAIEPVVAQWGSQPEPYYFQRLGQMINEGPAEWTCEECLQALMEGLSTLLQEPAESAEVTEPSSNPFHDP